MRLFEASNLASCQVNMELAMANGLTGRFRPSVIQLLVLGFVSLQLYETQCAAINGKEENVTTDIANATATTRREMRHCHWRIQR